MNEPTGSTAHPYPLFLDVRGTAVLIVGGGPVAERRLATLLESGAEVTVIAPGVTTAIADAAATGRIAWHPRRFVHQDTDGFRLVFSATGLAEVDQAVARAAHATGALVNVADDAASSDFHVPAIERRGPIQIAVGTGGAAPGLAALLRDRFAATIAPEFIGLAELLGEMRRIARRSIPDAASRMRVLARAAGDPDLRAAIACGSTPSPEAALSTFLDAESADSDIASGAPTQTGARVSIVGAGPGAPDLITARGLDRIRTADVIVYDDLIDRRLLEHAVPTAELVYAGKRGWAPDEGRRPGPDLLVERATEGGGRHVVRLKGGDPSVFARLDEEIAALDGAGIPYDIVPGVTAALAAAASAKLPLTARGTSASVTLVTAVASGDTDEANDLVPLVRAGGTVVVYMGLRNLGAITERLIEAGIDPVLPVAVISAASSPDERVVRTTLACATDDVIASHIASPALVVLGRVASGERVETA